MKANEMEYEGHAVLRREKIGATATSFSMREGGIQVSGIQRFKIYRSATPNL